MAENFDLIFGQNASQQYAWSDNDYQNGWQTVGNIPPTAVQFDALQRRNDMKTKELNDNLTPLVNANTAETRQPATAYNEGDMKYSPLLPTGWFLSCVVAGTTSAGEIVLPSPVVENANVVDGTVTWTVRKISSADGVPLGTIIPYSANGNLPSGYLTCDGAAVSRTMYPDLFALIGTTYGAGDGSTTFNLPNLVSKFAEGAEVAGTAKEAGLPNIEGTARVRDYNMSTTYFSVSGYSGALTDYGSPETVYANTSSTTTSTVNPKIKLDASLSNPIYGNSTTVQPDALTVRYIIKAFDGQTADSALIDITQYAQRLEQKADITGSNLVHHRDVIDTSGTYTAPVTGLYKITVKGGGGGGANGYASTNTAEGGAGGGEGGSTIAYEHMTAGDIATVVVGAGGAGGTSASVQAAAGDGGDSSVTVNLSTYTGGGGKGALTAYNSGLGGTGSINGAPGSPRSETQLGWSFGSSGGGSGGAICDTITDAPAAATHGGGGAGGAARVNSTTLNGGAGGDGYVWFEYYTPGA